MLFLFLSLALCDQYDDAEKIMQRLSELQSEINVQGDVMKNLSNQISFLINKLEKINISKQNNKKNIKLINDTNNEKLNEVINTVNDLFQDSLSSKIKYSPVNISLVTFTSEKERKKIENIPFIKSKFVRNFKPPSYPLDENNLYKIKGKTANFTFLSHHVERIAKIEINQTNAHPCGIKTFKVICTDHKNTYISDEFHALHHSESPQVFDFNRTIWMKTLVLYVIENHGDDEYICLPNIRVFDDDYYLNK
ncbi:hypothetical protein M9Y10_045275 [Tritrichomonas musculus]|uniref:SUN domain-containing protein n=1 Tax=Tritrichomonas musculus TaxID=1915356 RepID=A0ABR2JVZ7_9EUKA